MREYRGLIPRSKGSRKSTGGGRREGRKWDSQGGRNLEKKENFGNIA